MADLNFYSEHLHADILQVCYQIWVFGFCVKVRTSSSTLTAHLVNNVDPTDRTDFGRVVDEADVSLCGGVKLSDLDVPETLEKLWPNVCSDAVADGDPHSVVLFVVLLRSDIVSKSEQGRTHG